MGSIWHIGFAVPDLPESQKEFGEAFGLRWRPARVRRLTLADAAGRPSLRDLFPPGSEFADEPLAGSAL